MANLTIEQNSLTGGEISPLLYGRRDLPVYASGLKRCRNALPLVTGGVTNRPGSQLLSGSTFDVSTAAGTSLATIRTLQPFILTVSGVSLPYLIVTGVYTESPLSFPAIGVFSLDGDLLSAFDLPEIDGQNRGSLTPQVYDEKVFSFALLDNILYVAHPQMAPKRLQRGATDNDWTLTNLELTEPPRFKPAAMATFTLTPIAGITLAASAVSGTVTMTASAPLFTEEMLGKVLGFSSGTATITACNVDGLTCTATVTAAFSGSSTSATWTIGTLDSTTTVQLHSNNSATFFEDHEGQRIYLHGGEVSIYGIVDGSTAIGVIEHPLSAMTETAAWTMTMWSRHYGYPRLVCAADQRLIFGATPTDPLTIWGSRINAYGDFNVGDSTSSAPWQFTLSSVKTSLRRILFFDSLLVVSGDGILSVSGTDTKMPTAVDVRATMRINDGGSSQAAPLLIGSDLIIIPDDGRRLLHVQYSMDSNTFVPVDLLQHARHLITAPILSATYTRLPHPVIWLALTDGALLSCTFDSNNNIVAWARHSRPETPYGVEKIIDLCAVTREGEDDRLYLVSGLGLEEADYSARLDLIDRTATVDGTTATTAFHEGTDVVVTVNGLSAGVQTVGAAGAVTVPAGTTVEELAIGLAVSVEIVALPPVLQNSTGAPARAIKDLLLLHETQTLSIDGNPLPWESADGGALPRRSEWVDITSQRGWSQQQTTLSPTITLETPHDFTLLAIARQITVNS